MHKDTLLTSFIVDEITAQARYRDHLNKAAHRRLVKIAQADRPCLADQIRLTVGNHLIGWGHRVKASVIAVEVSR